MSDEKSGPPPAYEAPQGGFAHPMGAYDAPPQGGFSQPQGYNKPGDYGYNQPASSQGMYTNNTVVVTGQPQAPTTMVITNQLQPPSYLPFAIFVCLCCGCLFGLIGICLSMASSNRYQEGDVEGARQMGRAALIVCIVGIIVSVTVSIILYSTGAYCKLYGYSC